MMDLTPQQRSELWNELAKKLEYYYHYTSQWPVAPELNQAEIKAYVSRHEATLGIDPKAALHYVVEGLGRYSVHTPHPGYFGLFNPRPAFAGIMADAITATFNPQMAAWSHAPFANEVEAYLIQCLGERFGYPAKSIDGNFTSGGAEANLTAMLCALNHTFPQFAGKGLRSLEKQPLIYCSEDSHHSVVKAASVCGLGMESVRMIATDSSLRLDAGQLALQLATDTAKGFQPFMIVASLGATGTGAIDPIDKIYPLAKQYNCWLHADAAYGGALSLHIKYKELLGAVQLADSITFDAHKWLSVPMGAGIFITKHPHVLSQTFRITADYMPKEAAHLEITDPFTHSLQWSRRFTGLKLYLSLLIYGWEGFSRLVQQQIELGKKLKDRLSISGWEIYNHTELPVLCFGKPEFASQPELALELAHQVIQGGQSWLSVYPVKGQQLLRACVTNYQTSEQEINQLTDALDSAWAKR
jgi:glutamate/tyrosine decarboxylase-like PLP-dependent enzyme